MNAPVPLMLRPGYGRPPLLPGLRRSTRIDVHGVDMDERATRGRESASDATSFSRPRLLPPRGPC